MQQTVLVLLATIALLGVLFEEQINVSKAKITLFCGCLSWVLLFAFATNHQATTQIHHAFNENIADIANLWLFLIAAMTVVVYLNKKGLVDGLIRRMLPYQIHTRSLLFLTGVFCFMFSSLADNITATLISIALVLSLDLGKANNVRFSVLVVFAVNSGGVALISGDVTTLMIFLADKVSIVNLLLLAVPALGGVLMLSTLLCFGMNQRVTIERRQTDATTGQERREPQLRNVDISIAALFFVTILSAMIANVLFRIPPVLTFLTGLSIMFLVARFFKEDIEADPILEYIRLVEFETLFFFLGVLLIVGMLQQIGALDNVANLYQQIGPVIGNYTVGLVSAVVDNVPLTAALLKADPQMSGPDWLSLTYAVGVGGSLLIIGSAAGIVCMSKVPGLTVLTYARYLPAVLAAYTFGYFCSRLISNFFEVT